MGVTGKKFGVAKTAVKKKAEKTPVREVATRQEKVDEAREQAGRGAGGDRLLVGALEKGVGSQVPGQPIVTQENAQETDGVGTSGDGVDQMEIEKDSEVGADGGATATMTENEDGQRECDKDGDVGRDGNTQEEEKRGEMKPVNTAESISSGSEGDEEFDDARSRMDVDGG